MSGLVEKVKDKLHIGKSSDTDAMGATPASHPIDDNTMNRESPPLAFPKVEVLSLSPCCPRKAVLPGEYVFRGCSLGLGQYW